MIGLGFVAGLVGGIYGIGGGSLLAPVLVASGYVLSEVAPAALLSTWVTSCVGAATYAVMAVVGRQDAGPHWSLGLACGVGGLVGGYLGASLQPRLNGRVADGSSRRARDRTLARLRGLSRPHVTKPGQRQSLRQTEMWLSLSEVNALPFQSANRCSSSMPAS